MKHSFNTIIEKAKQESLKRDDFLAMKARIETYVDENTVDVSTVRHMWLLACKIFSSPWPKMRALFSHVRFADGRRAAVAFLFLFTIMSTGGVVFAAKDSLPGDALYPIKRTAERVQLALSFEPKTRAEINVRHALIRLDEAAKLSAEGKLDQKTESDLRLHFLADSESSIKNIEALQKGSDQKDKEAVLHISSRFRAGLDARFSAVTGSSSRTASADFPKDFSSSIRGVANALSSSVREKDKNSRDKNSGKEDNAREMNTASSMTAIVKTSSSSSSSQDGQKSEPAPPSTGSGPMIRAHVVVPAMAASVQPAAEIRSTATTSVPSGSINSINQ